MSQKVRGERLAPQSGQYSPERTVIVPGVGNAPTLILHSASCSHLLAFPGVKTPRPSQVGEEIFIKHGSVLLPSRAMMKRKLVHYHQSYEKQHPLMFIQDISKNHSKNHNI